SLSVKMSSFEGRMKEYSYISLDRFDRENLHSRAYFLSHCHKDHMKGLKGPLLKRKLKFSTTVKLYCSPVTKELLLSNPKYGFWEKHIVALELENPTQISLVDEISGEKEDVVVTLLPAGHCPGSVMFLIEGDQGTVLYTGDFRLAEGEAARMEFLHAGNRVKDIQSVYLDTTFFDPRYFAIPSREKCLEGIRELVKDWITLSPYHVVWFNCKAAYGYEYLFTNLCEEFGCQVHINSVKMFEMMPDILSHVTTSRETQIHACRHPNGEEYIKGNRLPCGSKSPDGKPLHIISIKPSTMWFGHRTRRTSVVMRVGRSSYRACFSFHSSYSEIKDFMSYICPVSIYPNVIPFGKTVQDLLEMLKPLCRENSRKGFVDYRPLGTLKRAKVEYTSEDSDSECDLFDEVDLSAQRRKAGSWKNWKTTCLTLPPSEKTTSFRRDDENRAELNVEQLKYNYVECTESNDDEDDEEENDEDELPDCCSPTDKSTETSDDQCISRGEEQNGTDVGRLESTPPKWETFFSADVLSADESVELESSQGQKLESSQSPALFSESDDDSIHPSSQSTHISEPDTESQFATLLLPMEERKIALLRNTRTEVDNLRSGGVLLDTRDACPVSINGSAPEKDKDHTAQPSLEEKSKSQASSDFEIPPTPESEVPPLEDLKELYKKLAAGEGPGLQEE
ncbi:protein artemis-like, partial [Scleropages formosus]